MTAAVADSDFVEPAYVWKPARFDSLLPKVSRICQLLGEKLEPEQAYAIDVMTGRKADGTPASLSAAVICARQNLKTYCLERIVLTLMLEPASDIRLILWTSQQLTTCDETFEHFVDWFEGKDEHGRPKYPSLARRLDNVDHGKGTKQVRMRDGKRLKFKARSPKSGQGLTGDVVVFDEAFAVEPEHMAALLPTLSTRRRAAVLYGSSAGHEYSEVLRGVRDRGRKGGPGAPAYVEWCGPGSFADPGCADPGCLHLAGQRGCSLGRLEFVQMANPMAGRRITWEYLADERLELPPDKFARERLGWWDEPLDDLQPIDLEKWADLAKDVDTEGSPRFFVDCSPNLRSASISGAAMGPEMPYVRMADYRPGTHWLVARAAELKKQYPDSFWQYEAGGPASVFDEQLRSVGIDVEHPFTSTEMARGCAHLQKLVADGVMTHSGDSVVTSALRSAVKRDIGDPGLWSWGRRRSSGDISPLVAVTGALWFLERQPSYNLLLSAY